LNLPAGKVGAVVGQDQFEITHGVRVASGLSIIIIISFEDHSFDDIFTATFCECAGTRQIYYCTYDPFFLKSQFSDSGQEPVPDAKESDGEESKELLRGVLRNTWVVRWM
jgi:hypothetical protein